MACAVRLASIPSWPQRITRLPLPIDDPQVRQPDITLAKQILGWEPKVSLREGLQRTIDQAGAEALAGVTA